MGDHRKKQFRFRRKKPRSGNQKKARHDEHHVYPSSRKIVEDLGKFKPLLQSLVLRKEIYIHNLCWHRLFSNLFAEEAVSKIKKAFKAGLKTAEEIIPFIRREIYNDQRITEVKRSELDAWRKLFGDFYNYRKIRKIIFRDWTYPGIKASIENRKVVRVAIFLKCIPPKAAKRIFENLKKCQNIQITSFKNNQLWKIT